MAWKYPISTLDSQRPPCRLRSNVDSWDEWPWSVENETIKPWQGTLESQCDLKKPPLSWDLSLRTFRFSSLFSHWWMRPFTTSTETPTIPFNTDLCRDALVHSRPHWEGKGLEVPMKGALRRNSFNMLGTSSTSMLPGKAIRCPSCLLISRTNILGLLHCEWKYFTLHELSAAYRVCLYVPFSTHRSMLSMLAWKSKNPPHKINIAPHAKGNVKISWRTSTRNQQIIHDWSWFHWHHGWGIHTPNIPQPYHHLNSNNPNLVTRSPPSRRTRSIREGKKNCSCFWSASALARAIKSVRCLQYHCHKNFKCHTSEAILTLEKHVSKLMRKAI